MNMLLEMMMRKEVVIVRIGEAVIGHLIGGGGHQVLTRERGEALTMELALALLPIGEREAALNMGIAQAVVRDEYRGVLNMGIARAVVLVE